MTRYSVSLVARTPQASSNPTLVEIDRLVVDSINYTDELNRPGTASLSVPVESLTAPVKDRLSALNLYPCEVWIYRGSTMVWAGEIQTIGLDGKSAQLGCTGLMGYLSRIGITADVTFTNLEEGSIVTSLINTGQNKPYGYYGISTFLVGTTGTTRSVTYLAKDTPNLGSKLSELAASDPGFDMWITPSDRRFRIATARGSDKSASVVLDRRVITSANVAMSVAPGDLATVMTATGQGQKLDGTQVSFVGNYLTSSARIAFGSSWISQSFDNVESQAELNSRASAFLSARSALMIQPGLSMRPRPGVDVGSFGVGDTVGYAYDAGLGLQVGSYRVSKLSVSVNANGGEMLGVEFV